MNFNSKLLKTEKGQTAFYTRSHHLSLCQRTAFALADGNRSVGDIVAQGAHLGLQPEDLEVMLKNGYLAVCADMGVPAFSSAVDTPAGLTDQEWYLLAKPLATQWTAAMGIRGFRLNLAVESAAGAEELHALLSDMKSAVGAPKSLELERLLERRALKP